MAKVLIACEESQEVCKAFRELGHEAYSCDTLPCSGGHPEWHIHGDVLIILETGRCLMENGDVKFIYKWDLMIAHPPCTDLAVSGARWFKDKQKDGRQQAAVDFFMKLWNCKIPKIAIENPVGIMSRWIPASQYIQPWQFGHGETKKTGLWLYNLPELKPTNIVDGRENRIHRLPPSKDRAKLRSKTYPGIAKAMAEQWGNGLTLYNQQNVIVQGTHKETKENLDKIDSDYEYALHSLAEHALNMLHQYPEMEKETMEEFENGLTILQVWRLSKYYDYVYSQ